MDIEEDRARVAAWVQKHPVTFPILLDGDGAITQQYGVTGTPTVFVVGRDGRLLGRASGTQAWGSPAGRALIEALLAS